MQAPPTVSYTHLDVYKRQEKGKKGHTPGLLNYPDGFDIDVFHDWKTALKK